MPDATSPYSEPHLLPTSVVGSYPQPDWLIDRVRLASRLPPRIRALELWRVEAQFLEDAQDDATRLAISDMEQAGIDIVTDGEQRRESYSNRFATALDGVDIDNPGVAIDRTGHENPMPRVVGPVARRHPVEVRDVKFLGAQSNPRIKITLPGPFTMTQQAQNDYLQRACRARARVHGSGERGGARPQAGGRRCDPDRRAVPPGAARGRPGVRHSGDQSGARGNRGTAA